MALARLQKILAYSGLLSRRKAEAALLAGRISVNGTPVSELGTKADPEKDEIRLDGQLLKVRQTRRVVLLHKPRRTITTKSDPEGRKTVMDLLPPELQSVKPVGRLDYESEGMLILTDDGELANRLAHPRYGVRKNYQVWVRGNPSAATLAQFNGTIQLEDGPGRFEHVKRISAIGPRENIFEVVVSEGRNRFVRRMWEAVGHPVLRLKRIRIGNLLLGNVPPGKYRLLKEEELKLLDPSLAKE